MEILSGIFQISLEQGLAYALVALGIVISFRILAFPDLTVDGSFVLGGAVVARMIVLGYQPLDRNRPGDPHWICRRLCHRSTQYPAQNQQPSCRNLDYDDPLLCQSPSDGSVQYASSQLCHCLHSI